MELVSKDWMVNKYFSFFLSEGSDPGNAQLGTDVSVVMSGGTTAG